ncbi:IS4 family transposase [Amycolatopsis magusensis]|uniref:IS4 family transposase n=1 Tax=Amycolatopsis magusensis TaxID=882444 RepID=UPI0024A8AC0C|nr:IS4 family transposase [Amycolatopsis magusensis]MDI5980284.1 IS4 family transposase [Amycolatopsis magusensis]
MVSDHERLTDAIGIGVLTRLLDRDLVDEVIAAADRQEKRVRLLPARVVVYYVLALCLFFGDGYEEVMRKLAHGLRAVGSWRSEWKIPTVGAISKARMRLGAEPLRLLFDRVAVPMAKRSTPGAWLRGLRIMAVDGVIFHLPETEDNEEGFGRCGGKNPAPFPQARVAALVECGTRAVVAAEIDPWKEQERVQVARLLHAFEPGMLVLADAGFSSYELWKAAAATGADLAWRVQSELSLPVLSVLPDGSYLSEVGDPQQKRHNREYERKRRASGMAVDYIQLRVIEYEIPNRDGRGEIIRLVTTILEPVEVSAAELAAVYHERWEEESVFDEIETHIRDGSTVVLRSKHAETVRQEIWALLLTHYAIRHLMTEAAEQADIDVDRISFIRSFRAIRRQVSDQAAFSPRNTSSGDPGSDLRDP